MIPIFSFLTSFIEPLLNRRSQKISLKDYFWKSKKTVILYINSSEGTYFMMPFLHQDNPLWLEGIRMNNIQSHFSPYIFYYFITHEHQERIALYVTSLNDRYFGLKIALYSNPYRTVELIIKDQKTCIVHQKLKIVTTHVFFIPLKSTEYSLFFQIDQDKFSFRFQLKNFFEASSL